MTKFPRIILALTVLLAACAPAIRAATPEARFATFDERALRGEPLTVVFLGGSLTWGANASDPNLTSYRGRMMTYLQQRYPKAPLRFHDAAIGGTGSRLAVFRLKRDVLAHKPDLVFLDFSANDDIDGDNPALLPSYERLLRELVVERGVPVVQVFLGFKYHFKDVSRTDFPPRVRQHLELAQAYNTGVANAFPLIRTRLQSGEATIEKLWPFDDAHPDDPGYELFFEAVRLGFEQAVDQRRVCRGPATPVWPDAFAEHRRVLLTELLPKLPSGWRCAKTYRTSMWYDGLSSRWLSNVIACDAASAEPGPLEVKFSGTYVGLLGERDPQSLPFRIKVDGKAIPNPRARKDADPFLWRIETTPFDHPGRLLLWLEIASDLPPGEHILTIQPDTSGVRVGGLRFESVCSASGTKPGK